MENTSHLKRRIVFISVLVVSLLIANFLINLASGSVKDTSPTNNAALNEVVPVFWAVLKLSNAMCFGYVDRSQRRGYLVLTGNLSKQSSERANLLDLILSLSGLGVLVFTSRKITRKVLPDE